MPCCVAPTVTATSPVTTPTRMARSGTPTSSPNAATADDQLEPRAHRPLGVVLVRRPGTPQTAITASPMNFSIVPP